MQCERNLCRGPYLSDMMDPTHALQLCAPQPILLGFLMAISRCLLLCLFLRLFTCNAIQGVCTAQLQAVQDPELMTQLWQ